MRTEKLNLQFVLLFSMVSILLFAGACSNTASEQNVVKAANEDQFEMTDDKEINESLKLIEKMPDSPLGYTTLASIYIKRARETGDFSLNSKAETAVNKALEIKPDDINAKKLNAALQLTFHRFDNALEMGTELAKEFPNDPFVFGVLTDANVELGNYEEAIKMGQKMVDLRPNTASYARVAHLRSLHGDHEGAVEMFTTAARTADPKDKETQSWCIVQLGDELMKNGKYERAEKVYDEALQNFPNYYLAIAGKGHARAVQGDFENAIKFLTEANNRVPNVKATIWLGDIYQKQGNAEKAKQQYDLVEVIEQKIGINNDQKQLALMWADQDIKLDQALEIARREHEMRKDIYTADVLAWTLYKKGNFEEAKKASEEAMRLKTGDALILYHAGMIEKELGNKAKAKELLKKALDINPSFDILQTEVAKKNLAELI